MQTQANKMSQNMFLVIDARKCDGYELKTRSSFAFWCVIWFAGGWQTVLMEHYIDI